MSKKGHSKEASLRRLYKSYIYDCRCVNRFFGLSLKEFLEIVQSPCHYCGAPPSNMNRVKYSGIDRKDNDKGYESGNVCACCKRCNSIKGEYLTYKQMLIVSKALKKARGEA